MSIELDSTARLQYVIDGTQAGTWEWNITSGEVVINSRWAEIIGYSIDELRPVTIETWMELTHPEDLAHSECELQKHFAGESAHYECVVRMRHKSGQWVWVLDRGKVAVWSDDGQPLQMFGTHQDITEQKRGEHQTLLAASVYSQIHEGIVICDAENKIVDVNEAFVRVTGYEREEIIGSTPSKLSSGLHDQEFYRAMWAEIKEKGCWRGEIWNRRKDGELYPEMLSISEVSVPDSQAKYYCAAFTDISALKEHEQELEFRANYDVLTSLPNRQLFNDRLQFFLAHSRRSGAPLTVALLDLDAFKDINETYGRDIGDRLLIELSSRFSSVLREDDTLARPGGDEFAFIFPDIGQGEVSAAIARRLLDVVAKPMQIADETFKLSASLGLSYFPQDESITAEQLLRQADHAMYQAKVSGKNRSASFDPDQDRDLRVQHQLVDQVSVALRRAEFVLYYQPKVNMRTGDVVGAEALIRWLHPQQGLLAPGHFLPGIENHNIMLKLGFWVMWQAIEQIDRWRQQDIHLTVSVNVAAIQLQQAGFVEHLQSLLRQYPQVQPSLLQLEVLESSALQNVEQVVRIIRECQAFGVSFALDDFGTGYSSLAYLKGLPATTLKIDRSFVKDMLVDDGDLAILQGIVGLAKAFNKELVAEGVELDEQADVLVKLGCEIGQGFGLAHPMPAKDLANWLANRS